MVPVGEQGASFSIDVLNGDADGLPGLGQVLNLVQPSLVTATVGGDIEVEALAVASLLQQLLGIARWLNPGRA